MKTAAVLLLIVLTQAAHAADNCAVDSLIAEVQKREQQALAAQKSKGLFSRFTQGAKSLFVGKPVEPPAKAAAIVEVPSKPTQKSAQEILVEFRSIPATPENAERLRSLKSSLDEKLAYSEPRANKAIVEQIKLVRAEVAAKLDLAEYATRKAAIDAGHATAKRTLTGDWVGYNDEFVKKTTENMMRDKNGAKKRYLDAKLRGDKHIEFLEKMGFGFFPSRGEILVPDILTFTKNYNAWVDGLIASGKFTANDVLRPARVYEKGREFKLIPIGAPVPEGFKPARSQLDDAVFMKSVGRDGLFPIGEGNAVNLYLTYAMHDIAHFSTFYEDPEYMKAFRQGYRDFSNTRNIDYLGPEAMRLYHAAEALSLVRATDLPKFDLDLPAINKDQIYSVDQVEKYLNEKYASAEGQKQLAGRLEKLVAQLPDGAQHVGGATRDMFSTQSLVEGKGADSYQYHSLLGMVHQSAHLEGGLAKSVARLEVAIAESAKISPAEWMREISKPHLDPKSRVYRFITESGLFLKDSQFYEDHITEPPPKKVMLYSPAHEQVPEAHADHDPPTLRDVQVSYPIEPESAAIDSFVSDLQGKFTIMNLTSGANPRAVANHKIPFYLEPTPEVEKVLSGSKEKHTWVSKQRARGSQAFRLSKNDVGAWVKADPHVGDVLFDHERNLRYKIIARNGDFSTVEFIHDGRVVQSKLSNAQLQAVEVVELGPRTQLETIAASMKAYKTNQKRLIAAETQAKHDDMLLKRLTVKHPERQAAEKRLQHSVGELNKAQIEVLANFGLHAREREAVAGTDYKVLEIDLSKSDPDHWMARFSRESGLNPKFVFDAATFLHGQDIGKAYYTSGTDFITVPWRDNAREAPSDTVVHEVHHWAVSRGLGGAHLPESFLIKPGGGPEWKGKAIEIYSKYYAVDEITARAAEAEASLMKHVRVEAAKQYYKQLEKSGKLDPVSKARFESLPEADALDYKLSVEQARQIAQHALPTIDRLINAMMRGEVRISYSESGDLGSVRFKDEGNPPKSVKIEFNPKAQRVELSEAGAARVGISPDQYRFLKNQFADDRVMTLFLQAAHNKKILNEKLLLLTSLSQVNVQQLAENLNRQRAAEGRSVGSISNGHNRGLRDVVANDVADTNAGKLILLSDGVRQQGDVPSQLIDTDPYHPEVDEPTVIRQLHPQQH